MRRGQVPVASVSLVLDAGEIRAPAQSGGLAVLSGDGLQGGTELRSGDGLAEALESLGSGLSVSTGWDATTIGFTCIAERVGEMLSLLSEVVRKPSFPEEEVERVQRQRLSSIELRRMSPAMLANDELARRLFAAEHPYHRPLAGDVRSVEQLGREDLVSFAEQRYAPNGGALVVVGDLSADQVASLAEKHFGSWQAEPVSLAEVPNDLSPPAPSVTVVHRPGSVQSEIRYGLPGPARGDPQEIPLRVANAVLGGAFTSRLNLSLREKHGFTYGAGSSFTFRRNGGAFRIGTAVQTEVTAPALDEMRTVLKTYAEGGPTREELARVRDYLAGVFPLRMETTAQLAARIAELAVYGLPDDYHHTYRDRIRAVDAASAKLAIHEHLAAEPAVVVIVGDADRIAPEVEGLGLGHFEVAEPWA